MRTPFPPGCKFPSPSQVEAFFNTPFQARWRDIGLSALPSSGWYGFSWRLKFPDHYLGYWQKEKRLIWCEGLTSLHFVEWDVRRVEDAWLDFREGDKGWSYIPEVSPLWSKCRLSENEDEENDNAE